MPLSDDAFAPVSRRQLLARMLDNLKGIYWRREDWARVVAVIDRLLVSIPRRRRSGGIEGSALAQLGDYGQGVADWERYLDRGAERAGRRAASATSSAAARLKMAELN